jgi:hypothetical protein
MKKFYFVILLLMHFSTVAAVEGCLVGNTFYTTYMGTVYTITGGFTGMRKTYNIQGASAAISYNGNSCSKVTAPNGDIPRNGALCFVITQSQYNSYPGGYAQNYPGGNGTLQNFTVYSGVECPLDDYTPVLIFIFAGLGFYYILKKN